MSPNCSILPSGHPAVQKILEDLTQQMSLTFASSTDVIPEGNTVVSEVSGALAVHRAGSKDKPIVVDFVGGKVAHRRKFGGGKGQDIAKAVGLNKGVTPSVLDATGGLGRDAFVLAALGCQVTLIERSPIVAALLEDGLRRGLEDSDIRKIIEGISLIKNNAIDWMTSTDQQYDAVYLDPMFPHREKSALVKKEMRLFQDLLGDDLDADHLLQPALEVARYRVVVKRPRLAPDLNSQTPTYRLEGKSCRYDIYALKAFGSE